jgi:hypothetical protein
MVYSGIRGAQGGLIRDPKVFFGQRETICLKLSSTQEEAIIYMPLCAIWFGTCNVYVRRLPSSAHVFGAFSAEAESLGDCVAFQLNQLRNSRKVQPIIVIQHDIEHGLLLG